jgi:hypothetical protein
MNMDPFEILVQAHRPAMKAVLAELVGLFRTHQVRYVIGGANALSLYVRPRMTIDIDAFVDAAQKKQVDQMLAERFEVVDLGRFHSRFKSGDVEINILYAGASAEDFALANARDAVILGTALKAASPEALLWLYLVSNKEQNAVDAVELMRAQAAFDVARVRSEIKRHDPALLAKLENLRTTAKQPVLSYEASRAKRS